MELYAEIIKGPFVSHSDGTIDCLFKHPVFGWIPFTASSEDIEDYGRAIHAYVLTQVTLD